MLVICETDGCFVDGISAATDCTVGHRSLRVVDYGKIAATFVDVRSERAIRVTPLLNVRETACRFLEGESRAYFAQLQAYRILPEAELLAFQDVTLATKVSEILSRPGIRVDCDLCGEEILNGRQVVRNGLQLCRGCAGDAYYELAQLAGGMAPSLHL